MVLRSAIHRRLLAEELTRMRRGDERLRFAVSQRCGRIDPNPHQIDAVVFALTRIPDGGCILADEVGLGKTIEAGLVISQLMAEGKRRLLLIVPKSLVGQWQTELYSLFGIPTREGRADPESLAGNGVFVVHREFAGGMKGAPLLSSAEPFDLVIIDEAHEIFANIYKRYDKEGHYRTDSSEAQIADRVRSFLKPSGTPVLLLTATPIQNSLTELWGLVQYVEPTDQLLGRLPTFRDVFCDGGDRGVNPEQTFELRRRLSSVVQRTLRRQAQEFLEVPFVERQAKLLEYSMSPDEQKLYDDVTAWLLDPYSCSFNRRNRRLLLIGFHRRMASSLAALRASLFRVAERLRLEIKQSGGAAWSDLTDEFVTEFEEDLDEILEADADDAEEASEDEAPTVERLRAELTRVEDFIDRAGRIQKDSKAERLLIALKVIREQGRDGTGSGKVVIFTESIRTQEFLFELLTSHDFAADDVTLFRGVNDHPRANDALERWQREVGPTQSAQNLPSRSVAQRLALVHEFREHSHVFISTEAGAKGLNLQFCETLINYDLPWNPQRIEQRIGRVHRYGQRRGVTVLNFLDRGNEAQRLTIEILTQKLDLFGKVLDASNVVLHVPTHEFPESLIAGVGVEFESQLRRIYQQARSLDDVTEQLRELRRSLETKRDDFDREQARAAELISTRLDDSVRQVFRRWQSELPAGLEQLDHNLDDLLSGYLTAIGATFDRQESAGRIEYQIAAHSRLPTDYQSGVTVYVGPLREQHAGEPFHPGHPLFLAAVAEARAATSQPQQITWRLSSDTPDSLRLLIGRSGRLVATKVAYRGFEPVDHILLTALLDGEVEPLPTDTVQSLLMQPAEEVDSPQYVAVTAPRDEPSASRIVESDKIAADKNVRLVTRSDDGYVGALTDAIDLAVMDDQLATTAEEEARFVGKLEQLDRFLDDQVLVLRRQQGTLARKVDEEQQRRERTTSPAAIGKANQTIESLQSEMRRLDLKIEKVRQGEDSDYQQWRSRLLERRYRQPKVERLFEAAFQILMAGESSC